MKLYLVQHGESLPEEMDPTRPLSERGKKDVEKMAQFLKNAGIEIEVIWHSTKLRAKQTAQLLAEKLLPPRGMIEKQGLGPNDPVSPVKVKILNESIEKLMIVGHLPFLGKLASLFLTNSETPTIVRFRPGGMVCLEQDDEKNWAISWMITPEVVRNP